jgi:hypothetical protein
MSAMSKLITIQSVVIMLVVFAVIATVISYRYNYIIAYGDAESHLNIAKRVVSSITPGFAQLGGIWLPLPHLLLIPLVYFQGLWRSGLAGSIISGASFIVGGIYLYKLVYLFTNKQLASFLAVLSYGLNPNILYMQTTPMTELPLIMFFILSTYFFCRFLYSESPVKNIYYLVAASFFGFCATLTRYDGWFLVIIESLIIGLLYLSQPENRKELEGKLTLFITLAFFGIGFWLLWDYLILNDPLFFTNSSFSAKSQQQSWLSRGELPTYNNLTTSLAYYLVTSLRNIGIVMSFTSIAGLLFFIIDGGKTFMKRILIVLLLFVPFIFYVITLYLGQSVIFIPDLTPETFEWRLFNVRYGIMMVPTAAFGVGYLSTKIKHLNLSYWIIGLFILLQAASFITQQEKVITWDDGVVGLSHSKRADAEIWLKNNYDGGSVLLDDFARTISIIRTNLPMDKVIYIGNKPYWEESLEEPEKYATWIVLQKHDAVWKDLYEDPVKQGRLYKYFEKAYTSEDILIFKRMQGVASL